MKLSHALTVLIAVTAGFAKGEGVDKLGVKIEQGVLTEIPAFSKQAPLAKLFKDAAPMDVGALATKPPPTIPSEWKTFTPTSTQNPATVFVGTLIIQDPDGKYSSSSDPIFLVQKDCKASVTIDSKEDKVYSYIDKVDAGLTINLGVVTLNFGHDQALELTVARTASVSPASGIDGAAVTKVKTQLDVGHNKGKYWICTAQELFVTSYQTYQKDSGGGSGTYSVVKINGTYFRELTELKKLYNFRLQLAPLESWVP